MLYINKEQLASMDPCSQGAQVCNEYLDSVGGSCLFSLAPGSKEDKLWAAYKLGVSPLVFLRFFAKAEDLDSTVRNHLTVGFENMEPWEKAYILYKKSEWDYGFSLAMARYFSEEDVNLFLDSFEPF